MSVKDGGSAFPREQRHTVSGADGRWADRWIPEGGMSLRDYFAAQALASVAKVFAEGGAQADEIARDCYRLADAMLEARGGDV